MRIPDSSPSPVHRRDLNKMAAINVSNVLTKALPSFDDELLSYITTILEDWSLDDRRSVAMLKETVAPFIVDTGYADEAGADALSKRVDSGLPTALKRKK